MGTVRIPLGSRKYPGQFALIDEADNERVSQHHWTVFPSGNTSYACSRIDGKVTRLHRFIMQPDPSVNIDHANRNGLDCRRVNLRECNQTQNAGNQKRLRNNTSGFRGVSWDKAKGRWMAYIKMNQRRKFIGRYDDPAVAAHAYDAAARQHFGSFARLNFPDD